MSDIEAITLEAEFIEEDAEQEIREAVSGRRSIARKYVMRVRRRHPDATPSDVIQLLERHYGTAISAAGIAVAAGAIAVDVVIGMIPAGDVAAAAVKSASERVAKEPAKEARKLAAKNMALEATKAGAGQVAELLPAGDQQLQFEITAIFALAIAEIHGMDLDPDQAQALVYGLTNERVSQQQIATMASDVADEASQGARSISLTNAADHADWSHWASTLAEGLPGGSAQILVKTIQTGQLDEVRESLNGKQQAAIEYGVAAVVGGATRFVFGREVIKAARAAFADAPETFPTHLALTLKAKSDDDDGDAESSSAFAALEDAAKATGGWIADTASTVGSGVASGAVAVGTGVTSAAGTMTRAFRSVDLDGDGIPDEPRALSAVKGIGGAIAGGADTLGGSVAGLFTSKKRSKHAASGSTAGSGLAARSESEHAVDEVATEV